MHADNPFLRGSAGVSTSAATAANAGNGAANDRANPDEPAVLALGPRTVTVAPGANAILELAIDHLNRIVTPFERPSVRTVSKLSTEVEGHVVYEEFELRVQRELRACHYVGSYCDSDILGICIEKQKAFCCFNTPLARIINEQAYPQLGRSWGEPEHPNCRGLSLQELERLDAGEIGQQAADQVWDEVRRRLP